MKTIEQLFKQWCKETKRSGGILLGSSLKEFFEWLDKKVKLVEKDEKNNNI